MYNLQQQQALVVADKVDLISPAKYEVVRNRLDDIVRDAGIHLHGEIMGISAGFTGEGVSTLSKAIRDVVQKGQSQS